MSTGFVSAVSTSDLVFNVVSGGVVSDDAGGVVSDGVVSDSVDGVVCDSDGVDGVVSDSVVSDGVVSGAVYDGFMSDGAVSSGVFSAVFGAVESGTSDDLSGSCVGASSVSGTMSSAKGGKGRFAASCARKCYERSSHKGPCISTSHVLQVSSSTRGATVD